MFHQDPKLDPIYLKADQERRRELRKRVEWPFPLTDLWNLASALFLRFRRLARWLVLQRSKGKNNVPGPNSTQEQHNDP